jgi:hypothetical protein
MLGLLTQPAQFLDQQEHFRSITFADRIAEHSAQQVDLLAERPTWGQACVLPYGLWNRRPPMVLFRQRTLTRARARTR